MTFDERVYRVVARIPPGRVSTYGRVAAEAGTAGAARAVGQALGRNPCAPVIPCHRVIGADLRIGGFQGKRGGAAERRKLEMLAREGVRFMHGVLEEPGLLYEFDQEGEGGHGGRKA